MNIISKLISATLLAFPLACFASDKQIDKVGGGMPIALYADAQGSKKIVDMSADDFQARLPLPIQREVGEYVEVELDNKKVWISLDQVRVKRRMKIDCAMAESQMAGAPQVQSAAARGAGEKTQACKKGAK